MVLVKVTLQGNLITIIYHNLSKDGKGRKYMILLIMYFIRILILKILFKADEIEYKTYRGGDIEWGKI